MRYGNWTDGPFGDGSRKKELTIAVPESVQENGSWFMHVFVVRSGLPIDPEEKGYKESTITYHSKCESVCHPSY